MVARDAGEAGWTRRVPGSTVLAFIVLSGGLWLGSLSAWELGLPELVVVLMAFAAFAPLVGLAARLQRRPVWALQVPMGAGRVEDLLRDELHGRRATTIGSGGAGHGGLFRGCDPVLRIDDPPCLLGVQQSPVDRSTIVLLLPKGGDREALRRFRAAIRQRVQPGG